VCSGASGVRNVNALFFILGGPGNGPIRRASGQITLKLCFSFRAIRRSRSAFYCVWGAER
jgi:hypothetical protein